MFTTEELEGILLLTDIAKKMGRVISALGMEMSDDEMAQTLAIRKKVSQLLDDAVAESTKKATGEVRPAV